ncbi:MAG: SMR family transporter [Pseudomonadota bacterium]
MSKPYIFLAIASVADVIATSFMKTSLGFIRFIPSVVTLLGYGVAFYFLTLTLTSIPTGIAYAIWSGVGIVLISLVGRIVFRQKLRDHAVYQVDLTHVMRI